MKTTLFAICMAAFAILDGCKSLPSAEELSKKSYTAGVAAAKVAEIVAKNALDADTRAVVTGIVTQVDKVVPQTNVTFEAAWTPIAEEYIAKYAAEKKLSDLQKAAAMAAFSISIKGIDYLINVKYPKIREYQELVEATTHGFCGGFLAEFKAAPMAAAKGAAELEYDKEVYDYLMESTK